jgi:hypothetical protein
MKSGTVEQAALNKILVVNYEKENDFLDVNLCTFVVGEDVKSPMNFNVAAFSNLDSGKNFSSRGSRKIVEWKTVYDNIE